MRLRSFLMLFGMLCRHCVSVPHVLSAFFLSFGVIFVAELGDKSQLMAMAFSARYKPWPVLV